MKRFLPLLIPILLFISCAAKIIYEGEKNHDGKYHGKGVLTWPNGDKYVGEFKDGKMDGQGSLTSPDGEKYLGEFKDGKTHGQGTYTWPDGEKYVGEFKDGKRNGQGSNTSPDGVMYVGEFKDNTMDGQGTITYPDGEQWEGEFKDNEPYNGQGTFIWADGGKYEGEYKDGKRNGQGTMTYPDGAKYVGEYKDGKMDGQGTFTWPDGKKYVGEYKSNLRNGQGTFAWPDGRKYVGRWKDDLIHGFGTYTYTNGNKYVGEHKDSYITGKGVTFEINGEIKSGIWTNGNLQDKWTFEAVESFLKNTYPQFKGFDYETPTTSVSLQRNEVYLPPPPDNPSIIAVVDFDGKGVSDTEASALTDRLRTELFNTKYFKVVERALMDEILEEQGLQQSGCTTTECIVEVGRLIGVEQIVGGSISKVGSIFSVSARIVSVETGDILHTATYDHKGEIDGLLTPGMKQVAIKLTSLRQFPSIIPQTNIIPPKIDWVLVEGGSYQMGSDDGMDDEKPVHKVSLSDYYISKTEVTYNQYKIFSEATGRDNWDALFNTNYFCNKGDHPQVGLRKDDAIAFCDWLGNLIGKTVRLPTEAEWEYAARGGNKSKDYIYSGSNNIDEVAWYWRNSGEEYLDGDYVNIRTYYNKYNPNQDCRLHPVAQKKPNELGLYDMSGNALEWCSDYYNPTFYSHLRGRNPLNDSGVNVEGIGWQTVMRGGAWNSSENECRNTSRALFVPVAHASGIDGLRLVMDK